jgi:hypothetical protein
MNSASKRLSAKNVLITSGTHTLTKKNWCVMSRTEFLLRRIIELNGKEYGIQHPLFSHGAESRS